MNARAPSTPAALAPAVTPELLHSAGAAAQSQGRPQLAVLEDMAGLAPEEFTRQLAALFCYPAWPMASLQAGRPAYALLPYTDCAQRECVLMEGAGAPVLVIADPFADDVLQWAGYTVGAFTVALAHPDDMAAYLAQQESVQQAMAGMSEDAAGEASQDQTIEDISLIRISEDSSPVVKLVNSTIYDALKLQASDIHLECDVASLVIKYRVDGVLVQAGQVQGLQMAEQVISRIKVLADLDIAERRVPQDGRFKVRVKGSEIDFRVSIMPNIFGEDAVLRLLDRRALTAAAAALRLESLGLNADAIVQIRRLAAKPHGMLLVTGPTGSGKTTTLYAAITEINTGRDKIVTIEDPVEYRLPRVLQIPVNEKKGLTFARGLRSILRHDPDKILIGEIRDDETAQIAVQASLTGHLVFTTVHANNVFDVVGRFLHMGVDPYSFAAALNGIVAQRLLRLNCGHCTADVPPDPQELRDSGLTEDAVRGWRFKAGTGCGHCRGTGYKGRKAVAEVLMLNDAMREMICSRAPVGRMKEEAARNGFRLAREAALELVRLGETTLSELNRVTY
ncbi:general secretion pathway protein GspE [Massilia sp. Root418]|jgi:general secretion pathway protein E|uniref:GspE/PulE family protein n=1 Tax=Massilia sp. Root418 TaxID=1736532 RepID=UPI0006FC4253|nr:GspE/PulE family protein [Massilia sp. Root418]KQW89311.1 general secretion pathway protein GspE [Massilia sp. Root418]